MIKKYHLFKMTKSTPCFKKGQKVWMLQHHPQNSIAFGRLKGTGKWIGAWIRPEAYVKRDWFDKRWEASAHSNHGKENAKWIGEVEISGYLSDLFEVLLSNSVVTKSISIGRWTENPFNIE
jgi:hypothetical protein